MTGVLGIDIGGTNTEFGLVDREGTILFKDKIKTRHYESAQLLSVAIHRAMLSIGDQIRIEAIGIGAPNGNYYNGTIEFAPNLEWKGVIKLADIFQSEFNCPVSVTNDANAAALGEMQFGAAQGLKDFVVITLGTGLGSGFVCNGEVLYGHTGMGGELGHVVIEPNGRSCKCGRFGCMERYASSTGFMLTAREFLASGRESVLSSIPNDQLHARHVDEAAHQKDTLALEIFEYTARKLAQGLATAIAITSPEVIVLCGGLARSGELLLKPTKRFLEEELLQIFKGTVELRLSGMEEENVAILGAAALGWQKSE